VIILKERIFQSIRFLIIDLKYSHPVFSMLYLKRTFSLYSVLKFWISFSLAWLNFGFSQTYNSVDSLFYLGKSYFQSGDFIHAAHFFEAAATEERKIDFPRGEELYHLLKNAAHCYHQASDYDKALELRKQSLEQCIQVYGEEAEEFCIESSWVGWYYANSKDYKIALTFYEAAFSNYNRNAPNYEEYYNSFLFDYARLYVDLGQFESAKVLFLKYAEIIEQERGSMHSEFGSTLFSLAELYRKTGQYDDALTNYFAAIENCSASLGKNHSTYGAMLDGLASLYEEVGSYNEALSNYQEALEVTENSLGKDHLIYGTRLNNLAGLYRRMGQYDKALSMYLLAIKNTENNLGKENSAYATQLDNLAGLYESLGRKEEANRLCLESLEITERILGKHHPDYAIRLMNMAYSYQMNGKNENVEPLLLEALNIIINSQGKDHPFYAIALNNLGGFYRSQKQFDKALAIYLESIETKEKLFGRYHPSSSETARNLIELYRTMDQMDKALPLIVESMESMKVQLVEAFSFMSETEKEQFQNTMGYFFNVYQSYLLDYSNERPEVATHAYDIELSTKGLILQSSVNMRRAILSNSDNDVIYKFDQWRDLKNLLAQEYSRPRNERRTDLQQLEENAEKMEAELAKLSRDFEKLNSPRTPKWQDIQKHLKEGEAAIEFASFQYHSHENWTDSIYYTAIVVRKNDTHPQIVPLFEQQQLDRLLSKSNFNDEGLISAIYRGSVSVFMEDQVGSGKALYDLIWKPLENYLEEINSVFYAPTGGLHRVSFVALPANDHELLLDRYNLIQLTSTSQIINTSKGLAKDVIKNAMLFGGVKYDLTEKEWLAKINLKEKNTNATILASRSLSEIGSREGTWNYLPGTLAEVNNIAQLFSKNRIAYSLFTAENALEEHVKKLDATTSPGLLHISTHGFFIENDEKKYSEESMHSINFHSASNKALLQSGLIFAGANAMWKGESIPQGAEDGILTAYEASNLVLNNTQLVVLSACETGLGSIKGSEGVFGLQRAFKAAGAEYIMMSLWKVPDAETAQFMTCFYEKWLAGETIIDAFSQTQKMMKKKYPSDPFKWAAFVLVK
jgi:CHAT domain-containing protein/predicted RNase H-like HicB family nuclease